MHPCGQQKFEGWAGSHGRGGPDQININSNTILCLNSNTIQLNNVIVQLHNEIQPLK